MDCRTVRDNIGSYVDGELPTREASELREHLDRCDACAAEVRQTQSLVARLRAVGAEPGAAVPPELWNSIGSRLDAAAAPGGLRRTRWMRGPLAAAASLALLFAGATGIAVWIASAPQVARATAVDYSVLLDQLPQGVDGAVDRFLKHYSAEAMSPAQLHAAAPELRFELPSTLPGGFRLEQGYRVQFGSSTGVAARYRRGEEPLFIFFHAPVNKERLGVHRESHCEVAGRSGQCVEVGPWRLLHFTDPTTCHCLLSRLESETELNGVFQAVAPGFENSKSRPAGSPR